MDGALVLDKECRVLYFNRALEEMFAGGAAKLRAAVKSGARCSELHLLEICEKECAGRCAIKAGHPVRCESKALAATAEFAVTATAVDGLIVETYRDISDEVGRRRELERTRAQLILTEKMSSLGRLLAGIAHELSNPINFVYGNIEFAEEYMQSLLGLIQFVDAREDLSPELRAELDRQKNEIGYEYLIEDSVKLLRAIRTGAERTAAIVSDLKGFSRTTPGKTQPLDVAAGIESTLNLIEPLLRKRIEVRRCYADSLPAIVCNPGHINQVFMNILSNAAQAIEGPGWIEIEIEAVESDTQLQVVISDSGTGISDECKARLSDPFFTTKECGTGLGLWISRGIVERHGGQLICDSPPGKGASFTVVLPIEPTPNSNGGEQRA